MTILATIALIVLIRECSPIGMRLQESRMKKVEGLIPESIYIALYASISTDKETMDHILSVALAQYLDQPLHTLFSFSTSAEPT
jgi:hypothetical protein